MQPRIFLLSPAHCGGLRARLLCNPSARFELARRLREGGVPLGEIFSFLSGLCFRGKIAYASVFARPPSGLPAVLVITTNHGLLAPETRITMDHVQRFGSVDIDETDPRYRSPLERDALSLARAMSGECSAVLLGSIATGKYFDVLLRVFGERLQFPSDFVGRGDMSRGGLLLRSAIDLGICPPCSGSSTSAAST